MEAFTKALNYLVQVQEKDSKEAPRTVVVPVENLATFVADVIFDKNVVCVISSVETYGFPELHTADCGKPACVKFDN